MSFDRGCTFTHCWQKYSPPMSDWQCQHMLRARGSSFFTIAITASLNKEARLVGRALAACNDNGPKNGRPPECYAENDSPQPQLFVALGLLNLNCPLNKSF